MKLFAFLLGVAAGAFGLHYYYTLHPEEAPQAPTTLEKAKEVTSRKMAEWHLTGPEIREEMERTGRVVRIKANEASHGLAATFSETRITTVINAKYVLDKELSARSLHVDCKDGLVTLTGTVSSASQLSKAVALALDTDGVRQVSSFIVVQVPAGAGKEDGA